MKLTTQNGVQVKPGDQIVVVHNDSWHMDSSFGQWFIAVYRPAAAYDSPYDPILWMPRTGYASGSEQHKARSAELLELAEAIAAMMRESLEVPA